MCKVTLQGIAWTVVCTLGVSMLLVLFFSAIQARTIYKSTYEDEYRRLEKLKREGLAMLKTETCTDPHIQHKTGYLGEELCAKARKYATLDIDDKCNEEAMTSVRLHVYGVLNTLFRSTVLSWVWSNGDQSIQSTSSWFAVFTSSLMGSLVGNILGMIGLTLVIVFIGYFCVYRPGRKATDSFRVECEGNVCRLVRHVGDKKDAQPLVTKPHHA